MTIDRSSNDTQERVLAAIRTAAAPVTADEVADELALHHNSVRSHAAALQNAGLIAQSTRPSGSRGRPSVTYQVTSRGAWTGERDYQSLAAALLSHLRATTAEPITAAREVGHSWGRQLAGDHANATDLITSTLDQLGFEPHRHEDSIELRNCPFRELVDTQGRVVCELHAGLLDGLTEESTTGAELLPFNSPSTCAVRLVCLE